MAIHPKFDTLLFDGDVLAFIAAAAVQHTVQDSAGNVTYHGVKAEGEVALHTMIAKYRKAFGFEGHSIKVCLSDRDNWRYRVDPDYKNNRDEDGKFGNRPLLLATLKSYLIDKYDADYLPRLEADDYLSLLMTKPMQDIPSGHPICIGRDKDFKSIPGWHYQIKPHDDAPEAFFITLPEADRWHLMQAIAGDATDGFKGCPGVGLKRAAIILDEGCKFVPEEGSITRGINKGERTVKWVKVPEDDPWKIVVSCYEKAGLGEADALDSARMARLLRHGEYDYQTGDVKLWTPTPPLNI